MKHQTMIIAGAALALSGTAAADEVWNSNAGEIVYEADLQAGQIAVLKFADGRAYLPGLAGVYEGRTSYSGFWISDEGASGERCSVSVVRPGTLETSDMWGRVEMTFIDPDFPGTWMARVGTCFETPEETIIARPVTAGSVGE